jgi:hypothetical protein
MTRIFTHVGRTLLGAALALGCSTEVSDQSHEAPATTAQSAQVEDGTPQAYGVLGLLNAASTTLLLLDDEVPLERRAAENLIIHRNGPDAVFGTADDNPFDDMQEVDAVPYVGPTALAKLLAYATSAGYVPTGSELLGVFDNVAFSVDEATATLSLVNTASPALLDDDVGLDSRAVDSILAARSIGSLLQLQSLYFVGQSAMLKLREFPKSQAGTTPNGMDCDAHSECQSGLCAGLLLPHRENGYCMEAWAANTFQSTGPTAISDDSSAVTNTITVSGLASVPLDVVVDLDIDHPRPQDLVVVLHQPGGASATLWNHQQNPPSHIVAPSGLEGDNMVNGDWILEVTDTVSGQSGTIRSWKMWISSNWD